MIWMKIKYRCIYIVPIFDLLPSLPQPNQAGLTLMFVNSHLSLIKNAIPFEHNWFKNMLKIMPQFEFFVCVYL